MKETHNSSRKKALRSKGIVDFHTHAFPDSLAPSAIEQLSAEVDKISPHTDGTVGGLLESMDRAGIERAVICAVSTKAEQFDSILKWCAGQASDRVIPFPAIHPDAPDAVAQVRQIATSGFKGLKMHPYYQSFRVDEERLVPIYEEAARHGLIVELHAGYDFAFKEDDRASPGRIRTLIERWPHLKIVAAHLGGWRVWEEVAVELAGTPVWFETSFSFDMCPRDLLERIIRTHGTDKILFGTDSPWTDQAESVARLRGADFLNEDEREAILGGNAARLLGD